MQSWISTVLWLVNILNLMTLHACIDERLVKGVPGSMGQAGLSQRSNKERSSHTTLVTQNIIIKPRVPWHSPHTHMATWCVGLHHFVDAPTRTKMRARPLPHKLRNCHWTNCTENPPPHPHPTHHSRGCNVGISLGVW